MPDTSHDRPDADPLQADGPDADRLLHGEINDRVVAAVRAGGRPDPAALKAAYPHVPPEDIDDLVEEALLFAGRGPPPAARAAGYEILGEVGRGAMGVVYKAVQLSLGRVVALKRLAARGGPGYEAHFENEIRALARLSHPHIVPVYEGASDAEGPFYVMEFVRGETLEAVVGHLRVIRGKDPAPDGFEPSGVAVAVAAGSLPPDARDRSAFFRAAAELGVQAAGALHHAHENGVVHRDVKPANLMVGLEGGRLRLRVTDFGLSALADDPASRIVGARVGTPRYMAPELGDPALPPTPRTDVFSLAAALYELVTLEPANTADSRSGAAEQTHFAPPRPPREHDPLVPWNLEAVLLKALSKNPADRHPSAEAFAADLEGFLTDRPVGAARGTPRQRLALWWRRNRAAVRVAVPLATAVVALVLLVSLVLIDREKRQTATERDAARAARSAEEERRLEALAALGEARRSQVRSDVLNAHRAWEGGDVGRALAFLAAPEPGPGEPDPRGWEWYYVRGLCHRARHTLRSPSRPLSVLTFSPDGRHLAGTGGPVPFGETKDGWAQVRVWDVRTGQEVTTFAGPKGGTAELAWGPGGTTLATDVPDGGEPNPAGVWIAATGAAASPGEAPSGDRPAGGAWGPGGRRLALAVMTYSVRVIDAATREDVARVELPEDLWQSQDKVVFRPDHRGRLAELSPDGRWLAVAGKDSTVRVRELADGKDWAVLRGHERPVERFVWCPDGKHLATVDADGTVRAWVLPAGEPGRPVRLTPERVDSYGWSPDGKRLALGWTDPGPGTRSAWVVLWEPATGRQVRAAGSPTRRPAWSPDGRYIALARPGGVVALVDAETGRDRHLVRGHTEEVRGLAWAPDGGTLAACAEDGTVHLWDPLAPQEAAVYTGAAPVEWTEGWRQGPRLAWAAGCRRVAVAGPAGTVKVLDGTTAAEVLTLRWEPGEPAKAASVCALRTSPDGGLLAAAASDGTVIVWETDRWAERRLFRAAGTSVRWSPDGRRLACLDIPMGDGEDRLNVLDVGAGRLEHALGVDRVIEGFGGNYYEARYLAWAADGRLVSLHGNSLRTLDPADGVPRTVAENGGADWSRTVVSPDGRWAAVSGYGTVFAGRWGADGGFTPHSAGRPVSASPNGRRLLLTDGGGRARAARVLDVENRRETPLRWFGAVDPDRAFGWSPDGRRLAAGCDDGRTQLWDLDSGELVLTLPGGEAAVAEVAWSPDGSRLATLDRAGTVRVFDARPGR